MNIYERNEAIEKVREKVIDILYWANGQNHINEEGMYVLIQNINEEIDKIIKEV